MPRSSAMIAMKNSERLLSQLSISSVPYVVLALPYLCSSCDCSVSNFFCFKVYETCPQVYGLFLDRGKISFTCFCFPSKLKNIDICKCLICFLYWMYDYIEVVEWKGMFLCVLSFHDLRTASIQQRRFLHLYIVFMLVAFRMVEIISICNDLYLSNLIVNSFTLNWPEHQSFRWWTGG